MTKPDFKRELQPGDLVRIDPRNRKGKGGNFGHWMRGRFIRHDGNEHVIVQPFGHDYPERMKREHVRLWKAKAV